VYSQDQAWIIFWQAPLSFGFSETAPYAISLFNVARDVGLIFALPRLPYHEKITSASGYENSHFIQAACCQILSPVTDALQQAFDIEFDVRVHLNAEDAPELRGPALACRLHTGDGSLYCDGYTYFTHPERLGGQFFQVGGANFAPNADWLSLPCPLNFELGSQTFTQSELGALELGDALLLPGGITDPSMVYLKIAQQKNYVWRTKIVRQTLQVLAKEICMENNEIDSPPFEPLTLDADVQEVQTLEDIPVRITFSLGSCVQTFSEIANIQPGYVMSLPTGFNQRQVHILANGKKIGQGELVIIGENLAVQIEKWQPRHEPQSS